MLDTLILSLCLSTASDVYQVPTWQLAILFPKAVEACTTEPYRTMAALTGIPVWPR